MTMSVLALAVVDMKLRQNIGYVDMLLSGKVERSWNKIVDISEIKLSKLRQYQDLVPCLPLFKNIISVLSQLGIQKLTFSNNRLLRYLLSPFQLLNKFGYLHRLDDKDH